MRALPALTAALLALLIPAPLASAAPTNLCPPGEGAGQCSDPGDLAVDSETGRLYLLDAGNNRIDVFDAASGTFLEAFGWGVADGSSSEPQTCTATCFKGLAGGGAGQFKLSFSSAIAVDEDPASPAHHDLYVLEQQRVQKLGPAGEFIAAWGGGVLTGGAKGTGSLSVGSKTIAAVNTTAKAFATGQTITGAGIPPNTKIAALGNETMTISKAATASGAGVALTVAEGAGHVAQNEVQRLTYDHGEGEWGLIVSTPAPDGRQGNTGRIFDASPTAAEIQVALEKFSFIAPGDLEVTGPFSVEEGKHYYDLQFKGRYADIDMPLVTVTFSGVAIEEATVQNGAGAAEVCAAAAAADCAAGVPWSGLDGSGGEGRFGGGQGGGVAVGAGGTVYVTDTTVLGSELKNKRTGRVQRFAPSGAFSDGHALFEAQSLTAMDVAAAGGGAFYAALFGGALTGIVKYDSAGTELERLSEEFTQRIALDAAGNLFALQQDRFQTVTEYDPSGQPLTRFGYNAIDGPRGLAPFHSAGGDVYVSEGSGSSSRLRYLSLPPSGPIVAPATVAVGRVSSANAVLKAEVNPEGKPTEVHFEYLTQAEFEAQGESFEGPATESTPEQPLGAEDFRLHPVEGLAGCPDPVAEAGEPESPCLDREISYVWRIVATNEDGAGEGTARGPGFETPDSPLILDTWSAGVGADGAVLHARVNPLGVRAEGFFEYVGEHEFQESGFAGAKEVPDVAHGEAPLDFGAGFDPTARAAEASGLQPGAEYRFRFVATNPLRGEVGPVIGPTRFFTTLIGSGPQPCASEGDREGLPGAREGLAAFLPDCRAYEMVSPVDKNGGDVVYGTDSEEHLPTTLEQSSVDGGSFAYAAIAASGEPILFQYMGTRHGGEGWRTHDITSPREELLADGLQFDTEFEAFSEDLCTGWLRTVADPPLAAGAPAGTLNLYRRTDSECGGPSYAPLTTVAPPKLSPTFYGLELQGTSADGQRAIFRANDTLAGTGAPPQPLGCEDEFQQQCKQRLYLHDAAEGTRFACVLPGGAVADSCAAGTSRKGLAAQRQRESAVQGAISADGSRVFWSAPGPTPSAGDEGAIYMREVPPHPKAVTTRTALGKLTSGSSAVTSLLTAVGKASFTAGSTGVQLLETSAGEFVAGQPVSAGKILPAGTTIVSVSGSTLTVSAPATSTSASTGILSSGPQPLKAGLQLSGEGIAPGTTIAALAPGELTLSRPATLSKGGVKLSATDECSAPELPCTRAVSAGGEALSGTTKSSFWCAAEDGSAALFTTGGDLYESRPDTEATHEIAGEVLGLAGCSADASRVYFASEEAIPGAGQNSESAEAQAGKPNLYLYEAGGGYAFLGTLASLDTVLGLLPVHAVPPLRLSRVAPDGGALAFMSAAPLTGQDNTDADSGEPDLQVFLYEAGSGKLACASCNPTAARPVAFDASDGVRAPLWAAGAIPGWENPLYASRVLSEDGKRLFFESADRLVARDTNGRVDVYQWEAPGEGTCTLASPSYSPRNSGCVDLISSGQGTRDAEFRDASPSGEDVFFATSESLQPQDPDLVDIYDARVGGGLPVPALKHTLTVHVTGEGEVSADSGTISGCTSAGGAACEGEYEEGAEVMLTETPRGGNLFAGWGTPQCDESTEETCEVTIGSGDEDVAASFEAEPVLSLPLKVALGGSGSGTVKASSGLIACSPFCEDSYAEGTKVTLTASPVAGSLFMAWKHCDAGAVNGRQCTVTMDKAKEVSALFYTAHRLTLSKAEGSGPGKVQSSPGGVTCLYGCKSTAAFFLEGTKVTLKAAPAKHFHLAAWGGDCSGAGTCEVSMGEDHEVSTLFEPDPRYTLVLAKSGAGQGIVKSHPAGIVCAYTCPGATASFYAGTEVTVEVSSLGKGSAFKGWSGAGCSGTGACTMTMSVAKEVTAEFE